MKYLKSATLIPGGTTIGFVSLDPSIPASDGVCGRLNMSAKNSECLIRWFRGILKSVSSTCNI